MAIYFCTFNIPLVSRCLDMLRGRHFVLHGCVPSCTTLSATATPPLPPGKSTTLGILSGDICPTRGQASIAGHDILTDQVT